MKATHHTRLKMREDLRRDDEGNYWKEKALL